MIKDFNIKQFFIDHNLLENSENIIDCSDIVKLLNDAFSFGGDDFARFFTRNLKVDDNKLMFEITSYSDLEYAFNLFQKIILKLKKIKKC